MFAYHPILVCNAHVCCTFKYVKTPAKMIMDTFSMKNRHKMKQSCFKDGFIGFDQQSEMKKNLSKKKK